MSNVDIINAFELVWWPALAVVIAARSRRATPRWRRLGFVTAFWLVLFGLSDGVELITKAWWNPWWLLLWKGTCLAAFVCCAAGRMRLKRQHSS
jgi:hypothetical protein